MKTPKKEKDTMKNINPIEMIKEYSKKFGIPEKDIHLHIHIDGNDIYGEECADSDWLVNEGICFGENNKYEVIPMYYQRNDNKKKVEAIRDK